MSDLISRQAAIDALERAKQNIHHNIERAIGDAICEILDEVENGIKQLPPIQPKPLQPWEVLAAQAVLSHPDIVRCKDCKHWKDSDGVFRRGTGAESKCPLSLHQVYEGTFFCGLEERREVQDENDKTTNNTTNA